MDSALPRDLDVERLLGALVIGGNALAKRQGAVKSRRRVPRKQESLVRLVASGEGASFDDLAAAFPKEWKTILKRKEAQPRMLAKREFFRNLADLAARVNGALLAGYEDPGVHSEMLSATGGVYVGLEFDYQGFEIRWVSSEHLEGLSAFLRSTVGGDHAPLRERPHEERPVRERGPAQEPEKVLPAAEPDTS